MVDEHGFGHHRAGAAGTSESGTVASRYRNRTTRSAPPDPTKVATEAQNAHESWNSPCTAVQGSNQTHGMKYLPSSAGCVISSSDASLLSLLIIGLGF
jgi:hypothetical protein